MLSLFSVICSVILHFTEPVSSLDLSVVSSRDLSSRSMDSTYASSDSIDLNHSSSEASCRTPGEIYFDISVLVLGLGVDCESNTRMFAELKKEGY